MFLFYPEKSRQITTPDAFSPELYRNSIFLSPPAEKLLSFQIVRDYTVSKEKIRDDIRNSVVADIVMYMAWKKNNSNATYRFHFIFDENGNMKNVQIDIIL